VSGTRSIRVVPSAARAIKEAAEWWMLNRPKAPQAFREELESALHLIASQPMVGARARNLNLKGVRRIHFARLTLSSLLPRKFGAGNDRGACSVAYQPWKKTRLVRVIHRETAAIFVKNEEPNELD